MNIQYPYVRSPEVEGPLPPRRRQHVIQPPNLLTTTLGNAHNGGVGLNNHTPISSISLSSPFSAYPSSPYPASPAGAMRGTSPMVHRAPSSFNAAYNPQQWGPVNNGSNASSNAASRTAGTRPLSQAITRVAVLAARPVGPDGKANFLSSRK